MNSILLILKRLIYHQKNSIIEINFTFNKSDFLKRKKNKNVWIAKKQNNLNALSDTNFITPAFLSVYRLNTKRF